MSEQQADINGIPVEGTRLVESVYEFNKLGAPSKPGIKFDAERVCFYIGMQLEEQAEMIEAVIQGCVEEEQRKTLRQLWGTLESFGKAFKAGNFQGAVLRADREELLDGTIDVAVVTIGALIYQTPQFVEALAAVLTANAKKFPNRDVLRDGNGKIMKPVGWKAPDLAPFVDRPID